MSDKQFAIGQRVRVNAVPPMVTLLVTQGTVIKKDQWDDYYVVQLDGDEIYHDAQSGKIEWLSLVRVASTDLELMGD